MASNGFNPIRHKCGNGFCYMEKHWPHVEVFAECFTGKIAFTDVDFMVERRGRFLLLEWKGVGAPITVGQRIMLEQFSLLGDNVVLVVNGDPKTMEVETLTEFSAGNMLPKRRATLEDVKKRMKQWNSDIEAWCV